MLDPDPDDYYDPASDYDHGWYSIQTEVTDPGVIGTLWVVRDGAEEEWTLLDREPIRFGFCGTQ